MNKGIERWRRIQSVYIKLMVSLRQLAKSSSSGFFGCFCLCVCSLGLFVCVFGSLCVCLCPCVCIFFQSCAYLFCWCVYLFLSVCLFALGVLFVSLRLFHCWGFRKKMFLFLFHSFLLLPVFCLFICLSAGSAVGVLYLLLLRISQIYRVDYVCPSCSDLVCLSSCL